MTKKIENTPLGDFFTGDLLQKLSKRLLSEEGKIWLTELDKFTRQQVCWNDLSIFWRQVSTPDKIIIPPTNGVETFSSVFDDLHYINGMEFAKEQELSAGPTHGGEAEIWQNVMTGKTYEELLSYFGPERKVWRESEVAFYWVMHRNKFGSNGGTLFEMRNCILSLEPTRLSTGKTTWLNSRPLGSKVGVNRRFAILK